MKYLFFLGIIILVLCISFCSKSKVEIINKYSGMVYIDEEKISSVKKLLIVKSQSEYLQFIKQIPEYEISKSKVKHLNQDPLLKKPEINFNKDMLVCIISNYMWSPPVIKKNIPTKNSLILYYSLPEKTIQEHAVGVGSYSAIILKNNNQKIILKELVVK